MNSFLILSSNPEFIDIKINEFVKRLKIAPFDKIVVSSTPSIGINEVKNLIKLTLNKPFSENRLIVFKDFQVSTAEAQNALLKFLEESPSFQTIILTADNLQNILTTVVSRCEIIKDLDLQKKENKSGKLEELFFLSLSNRLLFVQKNITSKEEASAFISSMIQFLESQLFNPEPAGKLTLNKLEIVTSIKKSEKALQFLERNLNYKHVLDILLLGFPRRNNDPGS